MTGHGGLEEHSSVRFGVSLIAPNIEYPNHQHPPEEGYLVISEGDWRQANGDWFHRKPGDTVHNVPNIWHAMRSGNSPLLAVWMLWTE
jgi:quercetin dioxygenase-like cupin family protein